MLGSVSVSCRVKLEAHLISIVVRVGSASIGVSDTGLLPGRRGSAVRGLRIVFLMLHLGRGQTQRRAKGSSRTRPTHGTARSGYLR